MVEVTGPACVKDPQVLYEWVCAHRGIALVPDWVVVRGSRAVDEDRRAGRFILTGSANLLTIPTVRESLAGRVETIPLYPLARSEILRAKRTTFLSKIFRGDMPQPVEKLTNDGLLRIVLTGGYPEALARKSERRRSDWHRAYLQTLMERDVSEIAAIDKSGRRRDDDA